MNLIRGIGRFVFKSLDVDLAANFQTNLFILCYRALHPAHTRHNLSTHTTLNFPTNPSSALPEANVNYVVQQSRINFAKQPSFHLFKAPQRGSKKVAQGKDASISTQFSSVRHPGKNQKEIPHF
jgi:hypothetical protein